MWKKVVFIIAIILLVTGLGFLLFPPVSNWYGKQVAHGQAETFDRVLNNIIPADETTPVENGVTEKTFAAALEKKQIDSEGYPIDESGARTSNTRVLFQADLDRLRRDSIAYNEDLKEHQGSKFVEGESRDFPVLNLENYGVFDGIYGYVSAPSIDMELPIYLGASDANMSYGCAHMTYTSLPLGGTDTNCSVAGHTGYIGRVFFDNIQYLSPGDKVYVKNFWETLTYRVVATDVVRPNESQHIYIDKGRDLFTMFTCAPYDAESWGRYFVVCQRDAEPTAPSEKSD